MRVAKTLVIFVVGGALSLACNRPAPHSREENPPVNASSLSVIDKLPKADGKSYDYKSNQGPGALQTDGTIGRLVGTVVISAGQATIDGSSVSIECSVAEGRLRVYARDEKDHFVYAEASPGQPVQLAAYMIYWGGEYAYRLQAVDGEAKGVTYKSRIRK